MQIRIDNRKMERNRYFCSVPISHHKFHYAVQIGEFGVDAVTLDRQYQSRSAKTITLKSYTKIEKLILKAQKLISCIIGYTRETHRMGNQVYRTQLVCVSSVAQLCIFYVCQLRNVPLCGIDPSEIDVRLSHSRLYSHLPTYVGLWQFSLKLVWFSCV